MHRILLAGALILGLSAPASAQSWFNWDDDAPVAQSAAKKKALAKAAAAKRKAGNRLAGRPAPVRASLASVSAFSDFDDEPKAPQTPIVVSGGPRPDISARSPDRVHYASAQAPGTIVIDTRARRLYLVQSGSTALVYPISVGREGFTWHGSEKISRVAQWPDWHPPAEMRERQPSLPTKMTGGINNPLGARALYLGNTLYRIHGTSDAKSIGRAASSGCFRMHNRHVVDLAHRVGVGTRVVVVNAPRQRTAEVD